LELPMHSMAGQYEVRRDGKAIGDTRYALAADRASHP
jgi:hypothetical protein